MFKATTLVRYAHAASQSRISSRQLVACWIERKLGLGFLQLHLLFMKMLFPNVSTNLLPLPHQDLRQGGVTEGDQEELFEIAMKRICVGRYNECRILTMPCNASLPGVLFGCTACGSHTMRVSNLYACWLTTPSMQIYLLPRTPK